MGREILRFEAAEASNLAVPSTVPAYLHDVLANLIDGVRVVLQQALILQIRCWMQFLPTVQVSVRF